MRRKRKRLKPTFLGMICDHAAKSLLLASIWTTKEHVERKTASQAKGRPWAVFELSESPEYIHADMKSWFLQMGIPSDEINQTFKTFAEKFIQGFKPKP